MSIAREWWFAYTRYNQCICECVYEHSPLIWSWCICADCPTIAHIIVSMQAFIDIWTSPHTFIQQFNAISTNVHYTLQLIHVRTFTYSILHFISPITFFHTYIWTHLNISINSQWSIVVPYSDNGVRSDMCNRFHIRQYLQSINHNISYTAPTCTSFDRYTFGHISIGAIAQIGAGQINACRMQWTASFTVSTFINIWQRYHHRRLNTAALTSALVSIAFESRKTCASISAVCIETMC